MIIATSPRIPLLLADNFYETSLKYSGASANVSASRSRL